MKKQYTKESLTAINQRYCVDHYNISDNDLNMVNAYVKLIEGSRSKSIPKNGDIIKYTNEYGEYFRMGHIEKIIEDKNMASICERSYVPFIRKNENNDGIKCSTSGGTWCNVPLSELVYVGTEYKTFCDWGSCGACKNGTIKFEAQVSVWEYKEKPLEGILYTTETHNRMFINYYNDTKTGYKFHGDYIAWESELELQAWLRTFRGEVANWGKNRIIVWYWKEKQFCVSPDEYEKINGIEDTMAFNGWRRCKRIYDKINRIVNTYFVWYWDDDSIPDFRERANIQNKIREEFYELPYPCQVNEYALKEIQEKLVESIDIMKVFTNEQDNWKK